LRPLQSSDWRQINRRTWSATAATGCNATRARGVATLHQHAASQRYTNTRRRNATPTRGVNTRCGGALAREGAAAWTIRRFPGACTSPHAAAAARTARSVRDRPEGNRKRREQRARNEAARAVAATARRDGTHVRRRVVLVDCVLDEVVHLPVTSLRAAATHKAASLRMSEHARTRKGKQTKTARAMHTHTRTHTHTHTHTHTNI
jgi:hypothetical protein